ncbi:hypothetical protein Tco_0915244 [Tanacetum coccineum]
MGNNVEGDLVIQAACKVRMSRLKVSLSTFYGTRVEVLMTVFKHGKSSGKSEVSAFQMESPKTSSIGGRLTLLSDGIGIGEYGMEVLACFNSYDSQTQKDVQTEFGTHLVVRLGSIETKLLFDEENNLRKSMLI